LALYLNKLDFPSSKDNLYQVWLNLACSFCRRRFFKKKFIVFLLFRYYLPLKKGSSLRFNKLESPLPKYDLCQVWLILAQWLWRSRKRESLQADRQTARQIDGHWTTGDQKSSLIELSAHAVELKT
jgi:hypothetical protein